jgi:hypothetical protein
MRRSVVDYAELADLLDALPWGKAGVPESLAPFLTRAQLRSKRSGGLPPGRIEYQLLAALGLSGWSVRADLVQAVNLHKGLRLRSGTYMTAFRRLFEAGLWIVHETSFSLRKLALVRLTPLGRQLLQATGLTPVVSEWERIEALHRGDTTRQMSHTAAICLFLHHARARGYATAACPTDTNGALSRPVLGPAEPDAVITRGDEETYVEVQGRGGWAWRKAAKWRHQADLQGYAAICALTPAWARRLAAEAQIVGVGIGYVTDLATLANAAPASLWTLRWRSRHSPLEDITSEIVN